MYAMYIFFYVEICVKWSFLCMPCIQIDLLTHFFQHPLAMGATISGILPALIAVALGFAILLIGMILAPILFVQQTSLLATGSSGDPNLTGNDRNVAGNIGTFFLIIIIMTAISIMIIPIISLARMFGGRAQATIYRLGNLRGYLNTYRLF